MTDEKKELSRKLILEALKKYGGLFNKCPTDFALETYSDLLVESFEFKQVTWALSQFVRNGSAFFPSCGEIFSQLQVKEISKDEKANSVVAELFQAIKDFSQYREVEMIEQLSEDARLTLLAMGGTSELRNAEIDNIGTTRAQLRDLAKSVIASKENVSKAEKLQRIGINTGSVLDFKKPASNFSTVDYSGYLPKDLA